MFNDEEPVLACSDKLAFDTREQAQAAATVARHQHGSLLKVYRCSQCGLWHLSSV